MKILMLEWKSYGNEDIIPAFKELGHEVKTIPFSQKDTNPELENQLVKEIQKYEPDFVFSFSYFPVVSLACKKTDMK